MGGRSRSSSTTSQDTTNIQDIDTTTIGIEDAQQAIVASGSVNVSTTDHGAIDAAENIARDSLDASKDAFDASIGFAGESVQLVERIGESSLDFADDFGSRAFDSVDDTVDALTRGLSDILDFGSGLTSDAFVFGRDSAEQSRDLARESLSTAQRAVEQVAQSTRSDASDSITKITLYIAIAAAVGFVAMAVARRK